MIPSSPSDPYPCGHHLPHRLTAALLVRRAYFIHGHGHVSAALWRLVPSGRYPAVYAVSLCGLGQRRLAHVGREEKRAREIFDLIVRNSVTPCALLDVLSDLLE